MAGFVPFAICFGLLLMIWFEHYKYFHRFGLHDLPTIVLNAVLLICLLFYVYTLKMFMQHVGCAAIGQRGRGTVFRTRASRLS